MKRELFRIAACSGLCVLILSNTSMNVLATSVNENSVSVNGTAVSGNLTGGNSTSAITAVLPSGGVNLTLTKGPSLESLKGENATVKIESIIEKTERLTFQSVFFEVIL